MVSVSIAFQYAQSTRLTPYVDSLTSLIVRCGCNAQGSCSLIASIQWWIGDILRQVLTLYDRDQQPYKLHGPDGVTDKKLRPRRGEKGTLWVWVYLKVFLFCCSHTSQSRHSSSYVPLICKNDQCDFLHAAFPYTIKCLGTDVHICYLI